VPIYRLRTDPPMSENEALTLCGGLKAKGIDCFLSAVWRAKPVATAQADPLPSDIDYPAQAVAAIAPAAGPGPSVPPGEAIEAPSATPSIALPGALPR
jgi:hypothetical protein